MKTSKIIQKIVVGEMYSRLPRNALNLIYLLLSYFYTVTQLLSNLTCSHHYYHISCSQNQVLSFYKIGNLPT